MTTKNVYIPLTPDLHKRLEAAAEAECRSLSGMAKFLIRDGLEALEAKQQPAKAA